MKKLLLLALVVLGGVIETNADVYIKGDFCNWDSGDGVQLTGSGTLTGELSVTGDIVFKLVERNNNANNWLGFSDINFDAPDGWIQDNNNDNQIKLNYSNFGGSKVKFLATYNSSESKWELRIEDADEESSSYTIYYVNGTGLSSVYAYTFGRKECGSWPGTLMTKSSSMTINGQNFDIYSYTFSAGRTPEKLIFTNNNGFQTKDLNFINNKTYGYSTFSVVGSGDIFSSSWDSDGSTNFMKSNGDGTYTYTLNNVELTAQTILLKVLKREGSTETWQADPNTSLVISEDGIYNITITSNEDISSVTAISDRIKANASVTSVGYATFSSEYALDFTNVTDVIPYRATVSNDNKVVLTKVTGKVPAETGLLLVAEGEASVDVPTTICTTSIGENMLVATVEETTVAANNNNYMLANTNGVGFYSVDSETTSEAGKAYLHTDNALASEGSGSRVAWIFDDKDITAIKQVATTARTNEVFDLQGRRVAQPTKGLYIVNGKKVIK